MTTRLVTVLGLVATTGMLALSTSARATDVQWSVSVGSHSQVAPAVVHVPPVVYAAPPVIYAPPQPRHVHPAPVVVVQQPLPQVTIVEYGGHGRHHKHGWHKKHHRHHGYWDYDKRHGEQRHHGGQRYQY